MSRLDELIKELCPNGVEHIELSSLIKSKMVHTHTAPKKLTKIEYAEEGDYPVVDQGQKYIIAYTNDSDAIVQQNDYVIFGDHTESFKYVDFPFAQGADGLKIMSSDSKKMNPRFLYHSLLNNYKVKGNYDRHWKFLIKTMIPFPPIEVQNEIVNILDKFVKLEAELEAELEARKVQYEFYRAKLFCFEKSYIYKSLGDIATSMYRGYGIKRDDVTAEGIPCVRYGEIYTTYNIWFDECVSYTNEEIISSKKYFEHGDILFAITGESVEEISKSIAYVGNEKCLAGGDIVVMKHNQNPKYIAYALSTHDAQKQKSKGKVKSKVVHSSIPAIAKIIIPVPSLEEQERIVNILDKFYSLINDLSEGLPAEIKMRREQYEYYRDKLLSFEEV